ncbi:MAG: hypothetical protein WAO74_03190 [Polaribacter sp.]|uniref:hypothetical protein n=1 Tax=Polaribacter sp. TaxID=1920175 RepID=UPI003BB20E76
MSTTYNQATNLTDEELTTFDYAYVDESQVITSEISFRTEAFTRLIYRLIEFAVKNPDAKIKIIFMSGTPNVETLVIPKIMKDYGIENLFQKIVVKKQYAKSPTIRLTHLDTKEYKKRKNAVMKQISEYINQNRKVVIILNNKEKMDKFHQDINTNIGKEINVGLFYSGSTGACTQNILSGKFGDYDVVLTTDYFINGININKDGLTEEDIKAGKTSTQKYGVVIDLGNKYSHISAIDTIQVTNRFRNRLCETTVFFPKIFKPDEERPYRKFHYGHTSKTLFGINRYNFHLLSQNENATPNPNNEEQKTEVDKIHLVDKFRNNPLNVSLNDIEAATRQEENERKLKSMIQKEARVYEDWYYSLDGYYFMAKDAGFNTIIEQKDLGEPLKEMTESQYELENKIIKTLIEDEKKIYDLINKFENGSRISIQASDKVVEPLCTDVGNFSTIDYINKMYTLQGDFHSSNERAINKLFRCYFKLKYYYDHDKALEIMRNLINSKMDFLPTKEKSYLKNIVSYVRACNIIGKGEFLKALNYIQAIDYLAEKNLGVFKVEKKTWTSYTITNPKIVEIVKNIWAKQQFELIEYKLNASVQKNDWAGLKSQKNNYNTSKIYFDNLYGNPKKTYIHVGEKDSYQKYFSNEEQIKSDDLEDLENQLKDISKYTPLSYTKDGKLKSLESIIVPKIIESQKLFLPLEIDENEYSEPEEVSIKDVDLEFNILTATFSTKLDKHIPFIIRKNNPFLDLLYNYGMNWLKNKDIFSLFEYTNDLIDDPRSEYRPGLLPILKKLQNDFSKIDQIFLIAFKAMEFKTFNNLTKYQISPFKKETFFCDDDFKFESLLQKPASGIVNKNDIYNALIKNSKQFINTKKIRPRSSSGNRQTVSSTSTYVKKVFLALNKKNELICADFSKSKFCDFVCKYAYKNDPFRLKNGVIPVKIENSGMYNSSTFSKSYLFKESIHKTVDNYTFEEYTVDIYDYVNYYKSL